MKNKITLKATALILGTTILLSSCASTTLIQSTPSGAKVYLNGEAVGTTPYSYRDTKITGSQTDVRLEKEGYETFNTSFSRNEEVDAGAIIGGIFVLFPFLWTMKYKPTHTYQMAPLAVDNQTTISSKEKTNFDSKAEKLLKLKKLLDYKAITPEEYKKEKQKILEE